MKLLASRRDYQMVNTGRHSHLAQKDVRDFAMHAKIAWRAALLRMCCANANDWCAAISASIEGAVENKACQRNIGNASGKSLLNASALVSSCSTTWKL
jgi:hypothetical protein